MKKSAILSAIALSFLIYNTANAQIRIHVGLNFEPRPVIYTRAPVVVQQPVYDQPEQVYDDYYRSRYNGREVGEWRHFNNNSRYGGGYARNNDASRGNDNHSYNRNGGYNRPEQNRENNNRYGNKGQGGFVEPSNQNRNEGRGNRGQTGFGRPTQNNGGYNNRQGRSGRPSTQNRDNRGANEHFAGNARPMGISHRQARY